MSEATKPLKVRRARGDATAPGGGRRVCTWIAAALLVACLTPAAAASVEPAQVLIINSFSRESSPYQVFASAIRAELAERSAIPVALHDVSLDGAWFDQARHGRVFAQFLRERFAGRPPDLVVPFGPLAARFYAQHRQQLFGAVPVLNAVVEARVMRDIDLAPGDGQVVVSFDFARVVEHILQVLPATGTIAVVIGDSPIERFWVNVLRAEIKSFAGRVSLQFWNDASLDESVRRAAALPSNAVILFIQMYVDGAGVSRDHDHALAAIRAVASVPIFGVFRSQLGKGIVGGVLVPEQELAMRTAEVASAMLAGSAPAGGGPPPFEPSARAYDARELERWNIPESRLPRPNEILFRAPSVWEQHKGMVVAAVGIVLLQSGLVAGLLIQRARRRRAERDALQLSGRILTAHEDERRRLARELHDDVTPRLARLAIEAARTREPAPAAARDPDDFSMHDELARLSDDVHAFSYRLHPTVLDDLGLVDALQAECDRAASGLGVGVEFDAVDVPERLPGDVALCLFRIAQEALRNVARHARAGSVRVSLECRNRGLRLVVGDDGVGFDPSGLRERPGLGHASMRERIRQVNGELRIRSAPDTGTEVDAWVPLPREFR